nr:MAG TPA: hypothetical protein [Caudoviricetes sp.]DAW24647.1 MAG TPA: hypothetical protein [Caudoviricetes sp.]
MLPTPRDCAGNATNINLRYNNTTTTQSCY